MKSVPDFVFNAHASAVIGEGAIARTLYEAVTSPRYGAHLGEATYLSTMAVAIGAFLRTEKRFIMPLSAHDARKDPDGVPIRRYETSEMLPLLESFRRVWMSDTVRDGVVTLMEERHGIGIATFACSGVVIAPASDMSDVRAWLRSGYQRMRALVDQGDRTVSPAQGFVTLDDLPHVDLDLAQRTAIRDAYDLATAMANASARIAIAA